MALVLEHFYNGQSGGATSNRRESVYGYLNQTLGIKAKLLATITTEALKFLVNVYSM